MRPYALVAAAAFAAATLHAQSRPCDKSNEDNSYIARFLGGSEQVCEVRSSTFGLVGGHVAIDSQNGSIEVIGENRQDVALEARITARAPSTSEADAILHQINITTGATVEAHGPKVTNPRNWSVSYKLRVPHHVAARLHTLNGSLSLADVNGAIEGETTNGSLHFDKLAGDVHLTTTNGSIQATLGGPTWRGSGLSATTTNGGVHVSVPSNYSAHLVASTTNGGASINLPTSTQTQRGHRRSIDTNLGAGGPTLTFETTNGGISIE